MKPCLALFRAWLCSEGLATPGYAQDLGWGSQLWFGSAREHKEASERQRQLATAAEPMLSNFAKLPQFRRSSLQMKKSASAAVKRQQRQKGQKRQRPLESEQKKEFAEWLQKKYQFSPGSASDYAWSLGKGKQSSKRTSLSQSAKPYLQEYTEGAARSETEADGKAQKASVQMKKSASSAVVKQQQRQRPLESEQKKELATWLQKEYEFSLGSANAYAWSLGKGKQSSKRTSVAHSAKPFLQEYLGGASSPDVEASGKASVQAMRAEADSLAEMLMKKRKLSDEDVGEAFRKWGFENTCQREVAKRTGGVVHSDQLGLVRGRMDGKWRLAPATKAYPAFTQLLCRWFREASAQEFEKPFCFNAITLNRNWQTPFHRDQGNEGPSIINCFTKCAGGALRYYHGDIEQLPEKDVKRGRFEDLDVSRKPFLFDGNRGHEVQKFSGERLSAVGYNRKGSMNIPKKLSQELKQLGFCLPTTDSVQYFKALLYKKPYLPLRKIRKHG